MLRLGLPYHNIADADTFFLKRNRRIRDLNIALPFFQGHLFRARPPAYRGFMDKKESAMNATPGEDVKKLADVALQVAEGLEQLEKCGVFCEGVGQPLWLELRERAEAVLCAQ